MLKNAIPITRKITKTELARYLNTWDNKPDLVSLGLQKNFDRFMTDMTFVDAAEASLPSVADYKRMIAKTIIFRTAHKLIRPMFASAQINVAVYTVALVAQKFGASLNLDRVWEKQSISPQLLDQIVIWAKEVNQVIHATAGARMPSESVKRPECKEAIMGASYSIASTSIPEVV